MLINGLRLLQVEKGHWVVMFFNHACNSYVSNVKRFASGGRLLKVSALP